MRLVTHIDGLMLDEVFFRLRLFDGHVGSLVIIDLLKSGFFLMLVEF